MYSKTSKTAHYLPRTGSYSTVPHRNGRVDVLPPSARESEIAHQELRSQVNALKQELEKNRVRLTEINASLAETMDWSSYARAESERANLAKRIHAIEMNLRDLGEIVQQSSQLVFANAFVKVARARLSQPAYDELAREAKSECGMRQLTNEGRDPSIRQPQQTTLSFAASKKGIELRAIIRWITSQEKRIEDTERHALSNGRSLSKSFYEDKSACLALKATITRLLQVELGER